MYWIITVGVAAAGAELLLYAAWRAGRRWRVWLAGAALIGTGAASGALAAWRPGPASALLALLSAYRAFNLARVLQGRMHEGYLHFTARRTGLWLLAAQAGVAGVWAMAASWHWKVPAGRLWIMVAAAQAAMAAALLTSTIWNVRRTRWRPAARFKPPADADLPAVSALVPARNETDDLSECLSSLIASDYPKLEILALDDSSQTRRTPEIIRSFAHDGVRFVQGDAPRATWLPKNQAYAKLAREASGEYLLFCGVDVRLAPESLRELVLFMLARRKQMVSVLPLGRPAARSRFALLQAMRYWWELAPPRRQFRRPPVLSSCWLITREALRAAGGFEAASRSIVPEAYLAKRQLGTDGYSFVRASGALAVASVKSAANQRATATRMRYPQLHRRPEWVLLVSLWELGFLAAPFVLAALGWWLSMSRAAWALALVASILLAAGFAVFAAATRRAAGWLSIFALPCMAAADFVMLHYSMARYEFSTVPWRARDVSVPAMHVYPHLPPV